MTNMLGVILCGGKSTRMGTDKGLIKLHANTWAQTALDKISALHLSVYLSVNDVQYSEYLQVFKENELIKDDPALQVKGPLAGVLSVHLQHPANDLFVLACDMPLMSGMMLQKLLLLYKTSAEADAYVFTNDKEPEPLCAIYTARALAYITSLLKKNELPRHSMKYMLEHIKTLSTPLTEDQKKHFRNFNAHAELNGL